MVHWDCKGQTGAAMTLGKGAVLLCWVLLGHDMSSRALKSKKFVTSYDMGDMLQDVTKTCHDIRVFQGGPVDMTCRDMVTCRPLVVPSSSNS